MAEYKIRVNSRWMFLSSKKENLPLWLSVGHQRLHRLLGHTRCERVSFHDLRHIFSTKVLSHGINLKTLSTILGYHAEHIFQRHGRDAAEGGIHRLPHEVVPGGFTVPFSEVDAPGRFPLWILDGGKMVFPT